MTALSCGVVHCLPGCIDQPVGMLTGALTLTVHGTVVAATVLIHLQKQVHRAFGAEPKRRTEMCGLSRRSIPRVS